MPTFYPSFVVDLRLSFDEALHVVTYPPPATLPTSLRGVAVPTNPYTEPLLISASNVSYVSGRVPLKADVTLPGYRQAGQFSFDLNFVDLPIDPRTVRSCAVDIYMGAVPASRFAKGMRSPEADGSLASVLSTRTAAGQPNPDTLIMTGIVDEWNVEHGEEGSTISIKGRDMRGVLLDTPISIVSTSLEQVISGLNLTLPIDKVIQQLLSYVPAFEQFQVVVNPAEWENKIVPSPASLEAVPRHRRGARGGRTRSSPASGASDLKFWDLIVRYCYLVGAIPYFEGLRLLIRPSRTIFDQARGPVDPVRNPTPFAQGLPRDYDAVTEQPISPGLRWRRLVYGRDMQKLSFGRKMGGARRPYVVRCVAMNSSSAVRGAGVVVEAFWPPASATAARTTRVAPSGAQTQEEALTIPVAGITDPSQLQGIARATYEEIGRGEMGGACSMKNLASFGGDNRDPDILRLRPGDGVEFAVDVRSQRSGHPLMAPLIDNQRTSYEAQVAQVAARIGDENLARVVVATTRGVVQEIQSFFRVQNVRYSWSGEGISIDFDFQNYVVARNQVVNASPDAGEAVSTTVPRRRHQARPGEPGHILARPLPPAPGGT